MRTTHIFFFKLQNTSGIINEFGFVRLRGYSNKKCTKVWRGSSLKIKISSKASVISWNIKIVSITVVHIDRSWFWSERPELDQRLKLEPINRWWFARDRPACRYLLITVWQLQLFPNEPFVSRKKRICLIMRTMDTQVLFTFQTILCLLQSENNIKCVSKLFVIAYCLQALRWGIKK